MIKEKRRRKKRWKRILIGLLIVLMIAAAAALAATHLFTVKKVVVSGNKLYTDEQIRESVLNDEYSWSSLYVFFKYRFLRTEAIPFVDTMEIEMLSPHELKVNIYEKAMIGYLEVNGQNVYIDKDGFVVEISKKQIPNVCRVEGLACNEVVLYEQLAIDNKRVLGLLLTFSQQLQKYGLNPETIFVDERQSLSATFGNVTAVVGGDDYLVEKVMRLDSLLPQVEGKKGSLHLERWSPLTKDVVFQPE